MEIAIKIIQDLICQNLSNRQPLDALQIYPSLKQIISKIPNKYGQIDKEVLDKIDQYQKEYNKNNLIAFQDDSQFTKNQKSYKNYQKSYQEEDTYNRLNRSSSFVDYRNSSGFQKDFKNYVKSRSKKNSSVFEEQTNQKDKNPLNQLQSQRFTRSYSQMNIQRKRENSSNMKKEENSSSYRNKFSLISTSDQQKSPYLQKYGKQNDDIQKSTINNGNNKNLSLKQNQLQEVKTPFLNPLSNQQFNDENYILNQLLNQSSFCLDNQKVLNESNSQNISLLGSKGKANNTLKEIKENQNQQQVSKNQNLIQNILSAHKQQNFQNTKHNRSVNQNNSLIFQNVGLQEDIIKSVQQSYNNYAKYKGTSQVQKISLEQSPPKERKFHEQSPSKERKLQEQSLKQQNNTHKQEQKVEQDQKSVFSNSSTFKNSIIEPSGYRYLAQSRSREKLQKSKSSSRYLDDEFYREESPIHVVNQNFEKRDTLKTYFNEIVMTHSRRQNNFSKNYEIQVKYRVKQDFIDQLKKKNLSIREALQSRIDYIQRDGSLAVFEQPTDEACIQSVKHTQLNKSLSPQKKQDLENILQNIEKYEESQASQTYNNQTNNQHNIYEATQFNFEKSFSLSPQAEKNIQPQASNINDFFTINQCLNSQNQSQSNSKRNSSQNGDKKLLNNSKNDIINNNPEQKKKSSYQFFQRLLPKTNQNSRQSLSIPNDSTMSQTPVSVNNKSPKKLSLQTKMLVKQKDESKTNQSNEKLIEELFQKDDFLALSQQSSQRELDQQQQQQQQQQISIDQSKNRTRSPIFYRHSEYYLKQLKESK